MDTLTIETINAAQNNDIDAVNEVIAATESRVISLATKYAYKMAASSGSVHEHVDEFAQKGRIAAWKAVNRFREQTPDAFFAFIYSTVDDALKDVLWDERTPGADRDAMKVFAGVLRECGEDVYLAEKLSQTLPGKGKRLSPTRAHAARLAWQGTVSTSRPASVDSGNGVFVHGGLSLADLITSDYGVPDDLVTSEDRNKDYRRAKHAMVHGVLDSMGEGQSDVIKYSFGIGNRACYGRGDNGDDQGLAELLGTNEKTVRDRRTKGLKAFSKKYIKVATQDEHEADDLASAAAEHLSRGGRKG